MDFVLIRLGNQRIYLKVLSMISLTLNYNWVNKKSKYFSGKIWIFFDILFKDLPLKEIDIN